LRKRILAPCTQSDDTSNHGALILAAWAVSVAVSLCPATV